MQVNLIAGAKYKGVFYRNGDIIDVNPKHVAELIDAKVISADTLVTEHKSVEEMKLDELKAYAKSKEIDLSEATKKEDILSIILEAQKVAAGE